MTGDLNTHERRTVTSLKGTKGMMAVVGKEERPAKSSSHRFLSSVPPDILPLMIDAEELCCLFSCAKSRRPTVIHLLLDAASSMKSVNASRLVVGHLPPMLPLYHHYLSGSQGCLQFYFLKTWLPESDQSEQNWLTITPIAKIHVWEHFIRCRPCIPLISICQSSEI